MAGDWIKLETTTPDKPEIFAIAEQLGIDPDSVVGKLVRVWIWADSQTEDGRVSVTQASRKQRDICHASVTHKIIDRLVNVPGFAAAMEAVGWLDAEGSIPGFGRHNGETAKKRALARERKARQRAEGVTLESRSERDKSGTREEKRREEVKDILGDRGRSRASDEVFDALIDVCGLDPERLTKSERGAVNNAAKQLRDVGAVPEEIRTRAGRYLAKWPGIELTPMALAKNWGQVSSTPAAADLQPPPGTHPPHVTAERYAAFTDPERRAVWAAWARRVDSHRAAERQSVMVGH